MVDSHCHQRISSVNDEIMVDYSPENEIQAKVVFFRIIIAF